MGAKKALLYLALFILPVVLTIALFLCVAFYLQNQILADLRASLLALDVPVSSVDIASRLPFETDITLQSASEDQDFAPGDIWNKILIYREAVRTQRFHYGIAAYHVEIRNRSGEVIETEEHSISLRNRQDASISEASMPPVTALDGLRQQMEENGFEIDLFEIVDIDGEARGYWTLLIRLRLADEHPRTGQMLMALEDLLETLDERNLAGLALCQLHILDRNGSVVLEYARDLKLGGASLQWNSPAVGDLSGYVQYPESGPEIDPQD